MLLGLALRDTTDQDDMTRTSTMKILAPRNAGARRVFESRRYRASHLDQRPGESPNLASTPVLATQQMSPDFAASHRASRSWGFDESQQEEVTEIPLGAREDYSTRRRSTGDQHSLTLRTVHMGPIIHIPRWTAR